MAERPLQGRRVAQLLATSTGGVGTHVRAVLPALAQAGASLRVCGPPATEQLFAFTSAGAQFRPVDIAAGADPLADGRAVLAARRATSGADLVHAHGLRAGAVAAAALALDRSAAGARPLVLTLHNALPDGGGLRRRVLQLAERAAVRRARLVLAASADLAENARRLGARDVRLAPVSAPALPVPVRSRAEVRAELGLASGGDDDLCPLVLAIGRLHPQKGYDVLLDAAATWAGHGGIGSFAPPNGAASGCIASYAPGRTPGPLVVIAGDGPLREHLQRRIDAERLAVRLLGRRADVAELLSAADVVALPSTWEARSLTAQEALRSGVPLVATRVGGLPELVGDAAVLVPAGDAAALAAAVGAVLTDPGRSAQLSRLGREQAARWPDDAATAAALVAVYGELLGAVDRP